MTADRLGIWLEGVLVAVVEQDRRRLRLEYTPAALRAFPGGTPLLSLQFPVSNARFPNGVTRAFLDGLLPEGDGRLILAQEFSLRADDTFGLIRVLGRDCAGALVIQPDGDPPPPPPTVLAAEPLTDDELVALVANLRSAPLGVDERVRISLAGVQEKLALTRLPGGGWGRPVDGAPSTHLLKPEIAAYPQTVENEAFCMRLARHLGLPVADVETARIAGRSLIVVARFDRLVEPSGVVRRKHQEDVCQAMGLLPSKKYEGDGGPSLAQMAAILKAFDKNSLETLVQAITLNVIVGNGDAHGKNFSLLHSPNGRVRFAPLYDVLSTLLYDDDTLAMHIDDVRRTTRVTTQRIVNEAVSWGVAPGRAGELVGEMLGRIPNAVAHAADETPGVPERLLEIIGEQLRAVLARSRS